MMVSNYLKYIHNLSKGLKKTEKEDEMQRAYHTTQEVARILGISKQTLLRYEKKKIFPKPHRNPINKRREYSQEDINKYKRITGRL